MNDEPACTCEESLQTIGVHAVGCPVFQNLIPNEIVYVSVPAPASSHAGLGRSIAVSNEDKQLMLMLGANVVHATQMQDVALAALAKKHGIDITGGEIWNYNRDIGTWVRTK